MEAIKATLKNIVERANNYDYEKHKNRPSLLDGIAGVVLLNHLYTKHIDESHHEILASTVDQLLDLVAINRLDYTFCTGKSGLNWLFKYLNAEGVLDDEDTSSFCSDDNLIAEHSLRAIQNGEFDFLHGGIGAAYYLSYGTAKIDSDYFPKVLDSIANAVCSGRNVYPHFEFDGREKDHKLVNLSLSHGLSSLIKFLAVASSTRITDNNTLNTINYLTKKLVSYQNEDKTYSFFPSLHDLSGKSPDMASRLSWCYGDLTIAYTLHDIGVMLKDRNLMDISTQILLHSANRRTPEQTAVKDGGVCHGSAGIAHVFNRMFHITKNDVFKDARDYWLQYTLKLTNGYQFYKYNAITNRFEDEISLLEGEVGIALVLLSYLTEDFSWDYCLMLNETISIYA